MRVLSLFDGIGTGRLALERAGIPVDRYIAYEYDEQTANAAKGRPYGIAATISSYHFPDIEACGNVIDADFAQYEGGVDLLIAGSPCQGFSQSGKKLNFEDPRSKLFFEFVRAISEIKPKYFMLENVPMRKEYEDTITSYLGVDPVEINSNLVSAQNRKRLYWVGKRNEDGTYSKLEITQPEDRGILLEDIVLPDALVDRDKARAVIGSAGRATIFGYLTYHYGNMVYDAIELSNIYGGFGEKKPRVHVKKSVTIRAGQGGGHIPSLVIGDKAREFTIEKLRECTRKVTPLECERLQTLPDNYTKFGKMSNEVVTISDTQRYKCIGNGWTTDVIAHIFSFLKGDDDK